MRSENIKYQDVKNKHLNKSYNYEKFQMMIFENPGGCMSAETSTTMVEETMLSRNSDTEEDYDVTDNNDESESNKTPPNTLSRQWPLKPWQRSYHQPPITA